MKLTFLGAAGSVTGSCYMLETAEARILLECGQIQGTRREEARNREPLPFRLEEIDAVVLSHAHIDHSGRLPLLHARGYRGPIYTHDASRALCEIMLYDSAYLHEKDADASRDGRGGATQDAKADWENRKRVRKGLPAVTPLYTRDDATAVMDQFVSVPYDERTPVAPGIEIRLRDAGHILGAAVVELWLEGGGQRRKIVFSGDLGYTHAPVMNEPATVEEADLVLMESTYGDRDHRPFDETLAELEGIFLEAAERGGNVLIPAFAVGRTQDLLYLMARHFDDWRLGGWQVFLDSPMAIETTHVYSRYRHLYRAALFGSGQEWPALPNLRATKRSAESMEIKRIGSGAIVIAGSGMCNGGRILHHLKHNLWRPECHVVLIGYQAEGTLGRQLVDGAPRVRLWQETIQVKASIHTVGGLSAHAGQTGLLDWYGAFRDRPPVYLVHGEERARTAFAKRLHETFGVEARRPRVGDVIALDRAGAKRRAAFVRRSG